MKNRIFAALVILVFVAGALAKSQCLVQTFTEKGNSLGQAHFGNKVSMVDDINGDGYDDMLVASLRYDAYRGCVYLYYGGEELHDTASLVFIGETYEAWFGSSVAGAGDVNNDGYNDIIIGAQNEAEGKGKAYIFYGGESMNTVPDVVFEGEYWFGNLGCSVASAGDVNMDGYDDVAIGEKGFKYGWNFGRVMVFFGGSIMDNYPDFMYWGTGNDENLGSSVAGAGDLNGDGYDDIVVGAVGSDIKYGKALVFFGGEVMDRQPELIFNGTEVGYGYAASVAGAGDVNNDGFADIIVGSCGQQIDDKGSAFIYFGGHTMDNVPDVIINNTSAKSHFGISVAGAGDVNGDHYDDVLIGAEYGVLSANTGGAFVYFGGETMNNGVDMAIEGAGIADAFGRSVAMGGDVNKDGYIDWLIAAEEFNDLLGAVFLFLGSVEADSLADLQLIGEPSGNGFGYNLASVGDVDGDGFDDFVATARGYNSYSGCAYLYKGGIHADNQVDLIFKGDADVTHFGKTIEGIGDCNDDGFSDIAIGSTDGIYIYFGGSSIDNVADIVITGDPEYQVYAAGDYNGDGIHDLFIGSDINSSNGYGKAGILFGGSAMDHIIDLALTGMSFFAYGDGGSACSSGDLNHDGFDDIAVCAKKMADGGVMHDRVYIYYGGSVPDGQMDLSLASDIPETNFGQILSSGGDFNADGYNDLLVSAHRFDDGRGRTYLYYGSENPDSIPDLIFDGEEREDYFGFSMTYAGDLNGDHYDDIVIGAYNKDIRKGRVYVYYGGEQPDTTVDIIFEGEDCLSYFGYALTASGDINHDGFNELLVGAYDRLDNGMVYLFDFHKPKKSQTIDCELVQTADYGASPFVVTAEATSGLPVKLTSSNALVAVVSYNTLAITGAGTAIVKFSQAGNMEYAAADEIEQTIVVNKAILTARANDTSKVYGQENPPFAISYEGFVNYDDEGDIDVLPVVTTGASVNSAVGIYDLIVEGGSDNNYDFTYLNGKLTISEITDLDIQGEQVTGLYPNPANDFIIIDPNLVEMDYGSLYSMTGEYLFSVKPSGNQVDVSGLEAGLYFLRTGDRVYKFIKE